MSQNPKPHFTIFCPIHSELSPPTKWLLQNLKYSGEHSFVIHQSAKHINGRNDTHTKYLNCSNARNEAKAKALARGREWFISLDSDVVPPVNFLELYADAIATIGPRSRKMEVIGGWYPQKGFYKNVTFNKRTKQREVYTFQKWVAGRWVAKDSFSHYIEPRRREWAPSNMVPLGCCLMHRSLLELTEFKSGCDNVCKDAQSGMELMLGECLEFGIQVEKLGTDIFMHPKIVCRHV